MSRFLPMLALTLLLTLAAADEEDTSDCIAGAIVRPSPPEALVEYRVEMAKGDAAGRSAAFSSEDMVNAREGRRTYTLHLATLCFLGCF